MGQEPQPRGRFGAGASLVLVVLLGLALYVPFLGYAGFTQSEGFRVFPAWEMLHNHDWLVTRLFEQPYLRKPPGMPWAIALATMIFGETEFAARSVSAFSMVIGSLVCWWAGRRWFGLRGGTLAGLAYLVAPVFWADPGPGRAAEIEALHNLCVLTLIVMVVDVARTRQQPGQSGIGHEAWLRPWHALAMSLALGAAFLVKGPSGLPAIGGVVMAGLLLTHSRRWLVSLCVALLLGGGVVLWWFLALKGAIDRLDLPPVREPAGQFLWSPGKELNVLLLPLAAIGAGMPSMLGPFFVLAFGPRGDSPGRILSLGSLLGIGLYTVIGVSNHRYVMPALTLGPLALPACVEVFARALPGTRARRLGTVLQLARPGVVIGVLALAGALYSVRLEHRKATRTSGKEAGIRLGQALARDVLEHRTPGATAEVWGDEFIDTRPEVLWYARREAAGAGVTLRVRWTPGLDTSLLAPPAGGYLILRDDAGEREFREPEWPAYERAGIFEGVKPVATGSAHVFTFRVYRDRTVPAW